METMMYGEECAGWLSLGFLFLSGCASMALNAGFQDVRATSKSGIRSRYFGTMEPNWTRKQQEKLRSLLKGKLTADDAVQIALLNNRDLQAVYSDLGVAQADLVQAGLLSNPIFDAAVHVSGFRWWPPRSRAQRGDELFKHILHASAQACRSRSLRGNQNAGERRCAGFRRPRAQRLLCL